MAAPSENRPPPELKLRENLEKYIHFIDSIPRPKGWDPHSKEYNLRLESASHEPSPTASFTFTVKESMCNPDGVLHGGCAATIVDGMTSILLTAISHPGFYSKFGVTRSLSLTYFRALRKGENARIVCSIVNAGRTMAAIRAEVYDVKSGKLCVVGENDKANNDERTSKM